MNLQEKQNNMKLAAIEFANGEDINLVMQKYNVCYASVYNALKKFNIPYEPKPTRRIFFDESYFETIDSEEKAYWLGFIFADGCILKTDKIVSAPNRVQIALSEKDLTHLEKLKIATNYSGKIFIRKNSGTYSSGYNYCVLQFNSVKMASDLIKLNCVPNKTDKLAFPELRYDLYKHFIRGYFDGDGSIYVNKNSLRCTFQITSNPDTLLKIQEILIKECNLNKTKLCEYKRTTIAKDLKYGGHIQVKRIFDYLYTDATIFLERKYDKFAPLLS